MTSYLSPLAPQRADPYLLKHGNKYYFTATCPDYDKIILREADSINGIAVAKERVLWTRHQTGELACHIWAPELHYIMGKWVIYFAAGHIPEILADYAARGGAAVTLEPHLAEFVGLSALERAGETSRIGAVYRYPTAEAAFAAAADALRKLL